MRILTNHLRTKVLAFALLWAASAIGFTVTTVAQQPADNEYQTGAVLWMQTSGERAALSYQPFSLARMLLDRDLRTKHGRMRRAGIADLEETIMYTGGHQACLIKNR